jgi:hypothetical protein
MNKSGVSIAGMILALAAGASSNCAADVIESYIEAPDVQSSYLAGSGTTDTFGTTNMTTNDYLGNIGTYTSASNFVIIPADQYGGAGDTGEYLAFGAENGSASPITITLNSPEDYLGVWVSAADANNGISFYSGTTLVGRFNTAGLEALLSSTTVTTVGGGTYASANYYGNPNNPSEDTSEPFAYVDFYDTTGTFTSIVLDNSGATGTGFESDNYTVYNGPTSVPPGDVFVELVPEPGRYAGLMLGMVLCLLVGQRMSKRLAYFRNEF